MHYKRGKVKQELFGRRPMRLQVRMSRDVGVRSEMRPCDVMRSGIGRTETLKREEDDAGIEICGCSLPRGLKKCGEILTG